MNNQTTYGGSPFDYRSGSGDASALVAPQMLHTHSIPNRKPSFCGHMYTVEPTRGNILSSLLSAVSRGSDIAVTEKTYHLTFPSEVRFRLMSDLKCAAHGQRDTILVHNAHLLQPNDLLLTSALGEQMQVRAIQSDTQVEVVRGLGTVPPVAISKGIELLKTTNAFPEGSHPTLMGGGHSQLTVRAQSHIVRHGWAQTGTMQATIRSDFGCDTNSMTGAEFFDDQNRMRTAHADAIESQLLFGQSSITMRDGLPQRTGSGILEFIREVNPKNIAIVPKGISRKNLFNIFDETTGRLTMNGQLGATRIGLTSQHVIKSIMSLRDPQGIPVYDVEKKIDLETSVTSYTFTTDMLQFEIYAHKYFNTMPDLKNAMLVFEPSAFKLEYLTGREGKEHGFGQDGSKGDSSMVDAVGGSILSEFILSCDKPNSIGLYYGLDNNIKECLEVCINNTGNLFGGMSNG